MDYISQMTTSSVAPHIINYISNITGGTTASPTGEATMIFSTARGFVCANLFVQTTLSGHFEWSDRRKRNREIP